MLAAGRNEVSSLQLSIDEPLSPELALVCPELAERARRLLPEPGWLGPVKPIEPVLTRVGRLHALVLAFATIALTVTPLALVLAVLPARGH